eukprot:CAMPEP_0197050416 /NCGR_PEP_ID=MMETSP1384-20130603/25309_1 /TAXON_ID=29189 /ORGANISM="Ammonia sp." /LENGTH=91 /DNA_ID=CAMNT_0042482809 /DNA_START=100 /DNA_END=371 /DNA_ORIENTATION=+
MTIEVGKLSDLDVIGPIKCEESGACADMSVGFVNGGSGTLIVAELDCSEAGSCTNLQMALHSPSGPVAIVTCKCTTALCSEVTFVEGVTCL